MFAERLSEAVADERASFVLCWGPPMLPVPGVHPGTPVTLSRGEFFLRGVERGALYRYLDAQVAAWSAAPGAGLVTLVLTELVVPHRPGGALRPRLVEAVVLAPDGSLVVDLLAGAGGRS